jgi:FkbM family methyltransferase
MLKLSLDTGYLRLKNCRYGLMLYLPKDQYVGQALDLCGEFSEAEVAFFRSVIQPNWTVLDIGANHGTHTVALARMAKKVGAFEPQRIIHQILTANVALNALENVYIYHTALGAKSGSIKVPYVNYSHVNNFGAISLEPDTTAPGELVPLITIDSLQLKDCHFMKVDAEGMESEVLTGAHETISQFKPLLYVENDRFEKSEALIEHLFKLGYDLYFHLPPYFNPNNYFGQPANKLMVWRNQISINMFGIHKSSTETFDSIKTLRRITSPKDTWNG